MSKRFALSLVVMAVALLVSSVAFASPAPSVTDEAFLSSLQAPAVSSVDNVPAPIAMACTYSCRSCPNGKLKFCTTCNGSTSCGACTTICSI